VYKIVKIVFCALLYLAGFDLIGVVACSFFDLASALPLKLGNTSTLLFYTVWAVDGIFCGLLSYDAGGKLGSGKGPGDWSSRDGAASVGLLVLWLESAIVAALSILCYLFLWTGNLASSVLVPDDPRPTLVFFAAIVAAVVLAHTRLRPAPVKLDDRA
jgi:hypothetical protein